MKLNRVLPPARSITNFNCADKTGVLELHYQIKFQNILGVYMENNLDRFWVSFKQWYLYELPQNNLIKEQFISYDEHDDAKPYLDIDFNHYYKLNFGVEYDGILEKDETITVKSLKMLTELTYSEFIKDRYAFTVDVNKRLVKFNIPLKLRNGVLISVGHKSSNEIVIKILIWCNEFPKISFKHLSFV